MGGSTWEEAPLRDLSAYSERQCKVHRQEKGNTANHKIKQLIGLTIISV